MLELQLKLMIRAELVINQHTTISFANNIDCLFRLYMDLFIEVRQLFMTLAAERVKHFRQSTQIIRYIIVFHSRLIIFTKI